MSVTLTGRPPELISQLALANLDPQKTYRAEIAEVKKKRSLDANAYYWSLLTKYAAWARVSETWIHNDMLAQYGQPMLSDGKKVYLVMVDDERYKALSYIHLKATSQLQVGKDDKMYRTYEVRRGSHDYNTEEFSRLIDGLISDIKGSGAPIETMTPDELERLKGYAPGT